ncbi:MAG: methyl-accepting chemotaxis protein [Nitrospinae bacterium]|nr:methyl-accepting chemotaxis protein [Nitrospinota bacterium]
MNFLRFDFKKKLITVFILIGFVTTLSVSFISYFNGRSALVSETENKLKSIRDAKKMWIEQYLKSLEDDIVTLAKDRTLVDFLETMEEAEGKDTGGGTMDEFLKKIRESYIYKNPNAIGKRLNLTDANDGLAYTEIHKKYHEFFKSYVHLKGYYDVFVVDPDSAIMYSVNKNDDFGTKLSGGKYSNEGIGKVWKELNKSTTPGEIAIADFSPYSPSGGVPAAFVATPIVHEGEHIGVLVFQMPVGNINKIMRQNSGMGETGESFLIGEDLFMRSDSRFLKEGMSSILKQKVDTNTAREAIAGKTGVEVITDYQGINAYSAYAPLDIKGVKWGIIVEIDEEEVLSPVTSMLTTIMIVAAVILGLIAVLGWYLGNSIAGPIQTIIEKLGNSSEEIAIASGQISSASQQVAEGTTEQASAIEETSASLEEMSSMTKQTSENAGNANELANSANESAAEGTKNIEEMTGAMDAINESSEKISNIIKVIDEIAFQTNLLALNAAVEAARAGEHGKGFAVVAEEVRNLAQRSATAAKEITGLIEENVNRAQGGTALAKRTADGFKDIVENVEKVAELISLVATASNEQSDGISQVNSAVSQMDQVTQRNASNSEETAASSEELASQAESLKQIVAELSAIIGLSDGHAHTSTAHKKNLLSPSKSQHKASPMPSRPPKQKTNSFHPSMFKKATVNTAPKKNSAPPPPKVTNADDIIPMDDDFKDF